MFCTEVQKSINQLLILSTIGTPTYRLAKFLVPILSPLISNEFSVHDSFSFADKVSSFCPYPFMASLDIESLFTNVPLNEVTDICIDDLFCDTNTIQNLDRNDMRELLNLAAYESFFIFDRVMYRQIDGVAMGSPLGPILANAFLCHFEKQWLSECPPDFLPKVFKRYVDDIFVMFLCQSHLKDFVNYMNTKHPNIKFTSEFEQNDIFSFLDVKITRSNNQLITSVFRKATFSGVFTNFKSFMPVTYKFGLVHTLLHRSFSICSSYEKFHEEIVLLKEVFKKNEYPQLFIDKCIKKYFNKLLVPKRIIHTVDKKQVLLVLPFLGPLSFEIRSRLQKCLKNYIPYCSLKVAYQSKSRISNLFHLKDVVNTKLSSHIVYKFMCSCCNATYFGQTQRHFFVRASEHLGITPLTGKFVKTPKKSAIFDHMLLDGHKASFDNFSIFLKENNAFKLQLKESLLISRDKPILNRNIYSFPLELFD